MPVRAVEPPVRAVGGVVTIDEAVSRWRDTLAGEEKSLRTIQSYTEQVEQVRRWAGWITVNDANYETAMAFIASRKRNDHEGRAWENGACRRVVSSLRSFGKFLAAAGLCPNPFLHLVLPKRKVQRHKHPFTESEARGFIGASLGRHARDARARGHAPLVWATLFWTGLRHSEVQAPCKANPYGGLKWRDVLLDAEFPGIWTDPKWIGNKSKTRDWIPLHPRLVLLLKEHREGVPNRPDDPVFPVWPIRATWVDDRFRARLPAYDDDGRALSVHATKATFATWVGKLVLPEGLRDRLTRHHTGIAEWVYGTRDKAEMAKAIAQLPDIWPEQGTTGRKISPKQKNPTKDIASANPIGYSDVGTHEDSPPQQLNRKPDPDACQRFGSGGGFVVGARGPEHSLADDGQPNPLTLIRGSELGTADLAATLKTLNWLVNALASRDSDKERGDGRDSRSA